MLNFVQVQERRKFEPQEYIEYFEDSNLSLTPKLGKRERFAKVSRFERAGNKRFDFKSSAIG